MKFKALGVLSMAALLCACSSGSKFESVDIVYLNPNHDKVMSEVLQSKPIAKTEAQKVFSDPNTTIEVYYDDPVNDEYRIQVVNLPEYYFTEMCIRDRLFAWLLYRLKLCKMDTEAIA